MKKIFMLVAVLLLSISGFGQTMLTGSAIPDSVAERLYFVHLSNMTVAQRTAYFAGNVSLQSADVTVALSVVANFSTSYGTAATNYSQAVTANPGNLSSLLQNFQLQQTSTTATALGVAQNNLSSAGYTQLQADIQIAKNGMETPANSSGGMACCYSTVKSFTMNVLKPYPAFHAIVTRNLTLEGEINTGVPIGVTHQGSVKLTIAGHTSTVIGSKIAPNAYMNLSTYVALDSGEDQCLEDDPTSCDGTDTTGVQCSQIGSVDSISAGWAVEIATTMEIAEHIINKGALLTTWNTQSFCANIPNPPLPAVPDYDPLELSDWTAGTPPWGWLVSSVCWSWNSQQPWSCSTPVGQYKFTTPQVAYANCAYNP